MQLKTLLLFIFVIAFGHTAASQTNCILKTDSSKIISIAKKKGIYWTQDWQFQPTMVLDTSTCTWTVNTGKIGHTNKGKCKYTNGCTVHTTAILVISAATGKKVSLEKKKTVYPNYE